MIHKHSFAQNQYVRLSITVVGLMFIAFGIIFVFAKPETANANLQDDFKPGLIISDTVFTNDNTMSVSQIQSFLNSKVPSCDTNGSQISEFGGPDLNGNGTTQRWEWAQHNFNQTTFTCLKNYSEGGKSAAQIVYDASKEFDINPQVLLVLLQKEQALITDTWPLDIQYRSATGYGCPDTAACDSNYYGLTNQIRWAATMFRAIMNDSPTWYTPYELGNNSIPWHPNTSSCGYSTVNIQNRSTQALYNYTPYRPNSSALSAGYGSGNSCSSYGNRNFYLYFTDWFGSTTLSYDAALETVEVFSDTELQNKIGENDISLETGETAYVKVTAKNTGSKSWNNSFVRVGTSNPYNRTSSTLHNSSWLNKGRPIALSQSSVSPTNSGEFIFEITA